MSDNLAVQETNQPAIVVNNSKLDDDVYALLSRVTNCSTVPEEVIEAIEHTGLRDWKQFADLGSEDTKNLTKSDPSRGRVPIGTFFARKLLNLAKLIEHNKIYRSQEWRDISIYTYESVREFADRKFQLDSMTQDDTQLRNTEQQEAQRLSLAGRSIGESEKAYNLWVKTKRDKTSFDILRDDSEYTSWVDPFQDEIRVQKLDRLISPDFEPSHLTDYFDKQLYEEQNIYLWTVLRRVLDNPLGRTCISNHQRDKDARAVYFEHMNLMEASNAQPFAVDRLWGKLEALHISTYIEVCALHSLLNGSKDYSN